MLLALNTVLAVMATEGEMALANTGIWIGIVLLTVAIVVIVVAPLATTLMSDPKSLIPILGGLVVLGIIYGIGYSISPDEITPSAIDEGLSQKQFKAVGGALIMVIILSVLAILSFVADTVKSLFN